MKFSKIFNIIIISKNIHTYMYIHHFFIPSEQIYLPGNLLLVYFFVSRPLSPHFNAVKFDKKVIMLYLISFLFSVPLPISGLLYMYEIWCVLKIPYSTPNIQ